MSQQDWWNVELAGKPDFETAMKRLYAWYDGDILDRVPVRFVAHNAAFNLGDAEGKRPAAEQKKRWFEIERRVDDYVKSIEGKRYHGETFPMFDPNLGPDIYAAFYGAELTYGEVTSWSHPVVREWDDMQKLKLDMNNEYFKGIEALMACAIERCKGKSLVGYTDLHPGEDCAMAWRGVERFCLDLVEYPDEAKHLIEIASADFRQIFDHFDAILKAANLPSMCWIGLPSFGKFHVPSCDFSAMISSRHFVEFSLPILKREVQDMTHVVYHVDGPGVARHIDHILSVPEVQGIQWVQSMGEGRAIMQWLPFIKKVQAAGKGIIVDLQVDELEDFIDAMEPQGIFLWVGTEDEDEQLAIIKRLEKWH
ncbi:MAG TPA: hypothetical protein PKD09_11495 [Aggregatilinea sp.]|uniref:hypothetical protein n=1 Tax=Aggregatilinea sp. TaxID=2806333 RepID=UPI002BB2FA7A|nr:hypothetical protein [Aggregatilinea sp.]HML22264.1 hypothetical protein [Aggregatilinea sp.]